jgi:hypothetical protein
LTRYFDRDFCGELMLQLGKRTARIVRRFVRGLSEIAAEEILMKVDIQIVELVLAATPSKQSEFLEVSFAGAVKRLTLDAVKSYRRSLLGGKRGSIPTDEEGDPLEGARELIDTAQNPEQHVLELEEESFRQQMLRTAFGVVEDKRALEVVILRFGYGWPIVSKDRRKNDLVSHFGATEPQIRYWISKTVKAMRDALENGENK